MPTKQIKYLPKYQIPGIYLALVAAAAAAPD